MQNWSTQTLVWIALVVVVIHDLEEIIWVEPRLKKNKNEVVRALPRRMKNRLSTMLDITSGRVSKILSVFGYSFALF
ncbi:HXXEE domain-containing protein [Paenibacillus sp. sgz500958]|uniref:HXXEE domain-containing protein n=1 Tax=Paenibacillus sp. sgz500958 TaxID=3242475 RepID=UPI0036D2D078